MSHTPENDIWIALNESKGLRTGLSARDYSRAYTWLNKHGYRKVIKQKDSYLRKDMSIEERRMKRTQYMRTWRKANPDRVIAIHKRYALKQKNKIY
jgi:hypothetical protein